MTPDNYYLLAFTNALASSAASKDSKLPEGLRRQLADRCAGRAVELLRGAVPALKTPAGRGFLEKNPAFQPLRERDDFKQFLRELGKPPTSDGSE